MAVLRRSSFEEDIDQDEDALLKSKWGLNMFPELQHSEQQELLLLEKWLQVNASLLQCLAAKPPHNVILRYSRPSTLGPVTPASKFLPVTPAPKFLSACRVLMDILLL